MQNSILSLSNTILDKTFPILPESLVDQLKNCQTFGQQCTSKWKNPTYMLAKYVIKGPFPINSSRIEKIRYFQKELAKMNHMCHVPVQLYCDKNNQIWSCSPNLGNLPEKKNLKWGIIHKWSGQEGFIIPRDGNADVTRATDYLKTHNGQMPSLECWRQLFQHLIDRFLIGAGDSGLWNILMVKDENEQYGVFGVDMEENRGNLEATNALEMFFSGKRGFAKKYLPNVKKAFLACYDQLIVAGGYERSIQAKKCLERSYIEWSK